MLTKLAQSLFVLLSLAFGAQAQTSTISVGPLLECGLTTFPCPGVSECCTIPGCCGSGCCANGYTCVNEGTSEEACCPAKDPTKCGTPSSSGSGSDSGSHTCTGISNCRDSSGSTWTCLLGQTCEFSYRNCDPRPYIWGDSSPSYSSGASPTLSSSPIDSSTTPSGSFSSSASPSSALSSEGSLAEVKYALC
ncbi:hypothetical protein F5Y09DRAFT_336120 [Xylaria sp. FL1042]|nr:hypothetical protein F5Y09DRAFT_336120 [Xylaria sp. FL1042]